ncbi:MAG: exo-beta-N-acetylmuramidase NamZ domain-containing protein [bacterium]
MLRTKKIIPASNLQNLIFLIIFACHFFACEASVSSHENQALTGLDRLANGNVSLLNGLRVGVITNQTAVTSSGSHVADVIAENQNIELVALLGPEHGIRGNVEAGYKVNANKDAKTGAPVYSLYGKTRKPTPEMLAGLDALVFDIQDIGTRFYTYISTMSLAMEAAAENGLKFIVLDRPSPVGGHIVEGPVLDPELRSFVGIHPIPIRHGMTVGELAKMFNEEGWLANGVKVDLRVVHCTGWQRSMIFSDYGKNWIPPSPNIPNPNTALLYAGIGLVETLWSFSEGRGTASPFEQVGAPWLDSAVLISTLREANINGVEFKPVKFTPVDIPGKATGNKYDRRECNGIRFNLQNGHALQSVRLGFHLITALQKHFPNQLEIKPRSVERLTGQKWIYEAILSGLPADSIIAQWQPELKKFLKKREKYLLYR